MMEVLVRYLDDALVLCGVLCSFMAALRFVHMLQLESYQGRMYLKWLRRNWLRDWLPLMLVFAICLMLDAALGYLVRAMGGKMTASSYQLFQGGVRFIYILLMVFIVHTWRGLSSKKPLVFTGRVKRLCMALAVVLLLIPCYPVLMDEYATGIPALLLRRMAGYLGALLLPLWVLLAYFITYPIEEANKRRYFNQAKGKLAKRTDLIKIGITGSYGKTSTKFVLGTLLKEKYETLITPQSYNTPMGITRVAREMLQEEHEVFVAEMGARHVGDIEELCELVAPTIGMLTSVGKQHLETFGSQENIISTKFELIVSLPPEGAAFFNADNDICRSLYERKVAVRNKFLYGIDTRDEVYMRAADIRVSEKGSVFTLIAHNGETAECRTRLLGRHNILNITGCAAVAYYMGVSMKQIAAGIRKLEPVEHRLQLIPGPVTVIDDAFNSNPAGAKAALEVLRSFDGRRFVITPGMIELGTEEEMQNEELGREMACSVDYAILVGKKRAEPIYRGMRELDFPEENIFVVSSLAEASAKLAQISVPGDVVLFENDLPDNYTE
jgi:UDP-N-acetylmuramoyl-tripeptide--D-alanyl-D-alanine ligase